MINNILSSAVLAGLIVYFQTNRDNKLKYITEERKNWRERIKKLISELISLLKNYDSDKNDKKEIDRILVELRLNLNPLDKEDIKIIQTLDEIEISLEKLDNKKLNILVEQVQFLLKFEWEKAKNEAKNKNLVLEIGIGIIILLNVYLIKSEKIDSICIFTLFSLIIILILLCIRYCDREKRNSVDDLDIKKRTYIMKTKTDKKRKVNIGMVILKILLIIIIPYLIYYKF
ncbi:hypothetical protein H5J22_02495 [Cetobacterium sp. 8H]|uniref:hypothetical protein n=1 Tax=Cetobacterium sp. 8H TaxID=2759681 RepID=UPI00163C1120|nr:hypothetical protein [Cetobacterium sp. 8H]MBC2850312.1 hypothetical protein [Cetobacterium sp. 8H]